MVLPRPAVSASTELVYDDLPEVFRAADAAQPGIAVPGLDAGGPGSLSTPPPVDGGAPGDSPSETLDGGAPDTTDVVVGGWPLLRYLDVMFAPIDPVNRMLERLDVDEDDPADVSELVDPQAADFAWLPWLAQLVGVDLSPALSEPEARVAVEFASAGWRAGTRQSIADAARSALTGTAYVSVFDHRDESGPADLWHILLVTRQTETPDVDAVLAAVIAQGAKPAGVVLHHLAYTATWSVLQAAYPTWADRNGLTWNELHETGL